MSQRERRLIALRAGIGTLFKRFVYAVVAGVASYQVYLILCPGTWFLSYGRATVSQTVFAGENVPVELCRDRKVGALNPEAIRTFYRSDTVNGKFVSVGQYSYSPQIEDGDRCVNVVILATRFAHTAGYWRFHTDLRFKVGSYEKTSSYDSNVYQVRNQLTNAQLQVDLQQKIDDLQRQLDEVKEQAGDSSTRTSPGAVATTDNSTARTIEPTVSGPPDGGQTSTTPAASSPLSDVPLIGGVLGALGL